MMHTKETFMLKMLNDLDTLLYLLFKKKLMKQENYIFNSPSTFRLILGIQYDAIKDPLLQTTCLHPLFERRFLQSCCDNIRIKYFVSCIRRGRKANRCCSEYLWKVVIVYQ